MAKNNPYVVINFEDGSWWWCDSATSPKAAIKQYIAEIHTPTEKAETMLLQAIEVHHFDSKECEFIVTVEPSTKVIFGKV